MAFTYWLPDEQGQKQKYKTNNNSVIIIGANGSGKSHLGAWIEQQDLENVHRIGAQRNLNFNEDIALKSYSQAENFVFYGTNDKDIIKRKDKGCRWAWGKYTTKLVDDFENVLAALIALKNNENDLFVKQCREAEERNISKPCVPITVLDKLQSIWKEVLPQRDLILEDSKFYATFEKSGEPVKYSANQMSDGERAVLYLSAQVLCAPKNKMLIMDEPEIHLHRSIMNRLWMALERYRPDCLFIYITHDTQFAAMHPNADKLWIKEYDGQNWKLEKIDSANLPEELLLDILGSRKDLELNGKVVGAANVGQSFTEDIYFWGRPSCAGDGYDATSSAGSNKGPTNEEYLAEVEARIDTFLKHHPYLSRKEVPAEMVTASGSGLDPDITPACAYVQVQRVAKARGMSEETVKAIVDKAVEKPFMGMFGTEKVNVLKLNAALEKAK